VDPVGSGYGSVVGLVNTMMNLWVLAPLSYIAEEYQEENKKG
jgi:hypothetical protein